MKKTIISIVVLALLGLFGWKIHSRIQQRRATSNRREVRAVPVEVSSVVQKTVHDVAEFTGTLLPKSKFVVSPKIPGRLEKLMVNIGDTVTNGTLIAVLDSAEHTQQVAEANADLEVSRANLADSKSAMDVAQRENERAKELREQKVTSQADLDEAEARYLAAKAKYEVAQAQIKQKEAALKAAEVRLSYTQIKISWEEGEETTRTVAERFVDEGAMLRANDPIVSIVDQKSVLAIIHVIEVDFPEIQVGQPASITTDAYPNRKFDGKVVRRAPVLKEESRQARVEIEIPNPDGALASGMFVRCRIQFAEHPDTTVVPVSALVRRNGSQGVFLVDKDKMLVRFVPIVAGITEGELVEILQPKLEGQVVTIGQHLLEDGAKVTVPEKESSEKDKTSSAQSSDSKAKGAEEGTR